MRWPREGWRGVKRALRLPTTSRRIDAEIDDELRFHLEGRIEDLMEREHLSRDEATREAKRRFGDVESYRRQAHTIDEAMHSRRGRMEILNVLARETRHAARALRKAPAFSFIAILTLALGLGATTAIFTLLDGVVLRPLPYPNANRLIHIGTLWHKGNLTEEYALSVGQYVFFKQQSRTLSNLALYDPDVSIVPGDGGHSTERVRAIEVSANLFSILGIRPERGRLFGPDEELSPRKTMALISHGYWLRRFGGDSSVIGKRLDLGWGPPVEIVGVLPASATVPEMDADIWTRKYINPTDRVINNHTHRAIGLRLPGASVEQVATEIDRLQQRFQLEHPEVYPTAFIARTGFEMHVTSLRDRIVGATIVRSCWLLFAAVAFVLLIAAANVANLFIVRIDARHREIAVRTALGAGRGQLALHYIAESMLIATVSAAGAVALAWALLRSVIAAAPQSLPRLAEVSLDGWSIAFCIVVASVFGIVFGLLPASSTRLDVDALRASSRGSTTTRRRELARRTLVLTQFTLAMVLLSGAALMLRSFDRLRNVRPGFDPVGVLTMDVILPPSRYLSYQQTTPFWHELTRRVEALPGVVRAGATSALPLDGGFGGNGILAEGASDPTKATRLVGLVQVTPGFFETMGMKVSGTLPTWSTVEAGQAPAIASSVYAKVTWTNGNAVGHRVNPFNERMPFFHVVGVAEDMYGNGFREPPVDAVFFPIVPPPLPDSMAKAFGGAYWASRSMTLVVRAPQANFGTLATAIREIVAQMDPQVPIADVRPMELIVAKSMADTSFTMALLVIAATIAMILSAVGIYGVISYLVSQRRGEIGIRIALGAQMTEVSRLVVGQSLRLAVAGIALGIIASLGATRFLGSLLFEVSPTDPFSLGATAIVLLGVALLASFGPTRRASKIDPVEAMRG